MGYEAYLTDLLRPLGVYDLEGGVFSPAELAGEGAALDGAGDALDRVAREMVLLTARDRGLDAVEALLPYRPVTSTLAQRRAALAALLRIGGDSFTQRDINDNLTGCGLNALAAETGTTGRVSVSFPGVPGIPEGFDEMRRIIEDILPCHLEVKYRFWYSTWAELEARFPTWGDIQAGGYIWEELEKLVE